MKGNPGEKKGSETEKKAHCNYALYSVIAILIVGVEISSCSSTSIGS